MDALQFHHIALSVADLDRSLAWYQDLFGFEISFMEKSDRRRASVLQFAGGTFGLVEHRPGAGSPGTVFDPTVVGLDHLAFTVASLDELDEWVGRLSDRSIEHSGVIEVPPGWILNFRDPDGIQLALFVDR